MEARTLLGSWSIGPTFQPEKASMPRDKTQKCSPWREVMVGEERCGDRGCWCIYRRYSRSKHENPPNVDIELMQSTQLPYILQTTQMLSLTLNVTDLSGIAPRGWRAVWLSRQRVPIMCSARWIRLAWLWHRNESNWGSKTWVIQRPTAERIRSRGVKVR